MVATHCQIRFPMLTSAEMSTNFFALIKIHPRNVEKKMSQYLSGPKARKMMSPKYMSTASRNSA